VLEDLFGEAAVKAFAFALRLGVVGLAVDHVDAEAKEPRARLRKEGPPRNGTPSADEEIRRGGR
jgi:hypothetical protein